MFSFTPEFNPAGWSFVDTGLGAIAGEPAEQGKFKVPGLRNIAKTGPYMHNGYFKTLRGVLEFYNNRDVWRDCKNPFVSETLALNNRCWPEPEVKKNVNFAELGELGLSEGEINDIVAFLNTLTDGYTK
jgi:cytochrome c peroxidase